MPSVNRPDSLSKLNQRRTASGAPPVYRPSHQASAKVAQTAPAPVCPPGNINNVGQRKSAGTAPPVYRPNQQTSPRTAQTTPPAAYRPGSTDNVGQRKSAGIAPPVYRPNQQTSPRTAQTTPPAAYRPGSINVGQKKSAGVAPPVYRPNQRTSLKMAQSGPPPLYRPEGVNNAGQNSADAISRRVNNTLPRLPHIHLPHSAAPTPLGNGVPQIQRAVTAGPALLPQTSTQLRPGAGTAPNSSGMLGAVVKAPAPARLHTFQLSAAIQCLMTATAFRDRMVKFGRDRGYGNEKNLYVKRICSGLTTYHGEAAPWFFGRQGFSDRRMAALDKIEHAIYGWLDVNRRNRDLAAERRLMLDLLDEVQEAHIAHVDYIHTYNLNLYTSDTLTQQERTTLNTDWNALRAGSGVIKFSAGTPQAIRELRSIHARLLSRGEGRSLLHEVLNQEGEQWNTNVEFTPAYESTREKRDRIAVNKRNLASLAELRTKLQKELTFLEESVAKFEEAHKNYGDDYRLRRQRLEAEDPTYKRCNARIEWLADAIGKIDDEIVKYGDGAFPDYAVGEPDPALAGTGVGNSLKVSLRTGLRDSSQLNFDREGNLIAAPAFLIYGHELVHVLQKRYPTRMVLAPQIYPSGHAKHLYHNTSEHETIRKLSKVRTGAHLRFSENLLRGEHRVTPRKHHTGMSRSEVEGR